MKQPDKIINKVYVVPDIITALSSEETLKIILDEYNGNFTTENENERPYSALMSKALNFAVRNSPRQLVKKPHEKLYQDNLEYYQSVTEIYKATVDELVKEKGRVTDYAVAKRFNEIDVATLGGKHGAWDATRIVNLKKRLAKEKATENRAVKNNAALKRKPDALSI